MHKRIDPLFRLTETTPSRSERRALLAEFAQEHGWYPSDQLEVFPGSGSLANGHLIVEHGLSNSAVLTFLKPDRPYRLLNTRERLHLLGLSYNNLVDWHYFPDVHGVTLVNNRSSSIEGQYIPRADAVRAEEFEDITRDFRPPELRSLDDVLISTISFYKRAMVADLGPVATNEVVSTFFNAAILLRALEDHARWESGQSGQILIEAFVGNGAEHRSNTQCLDWALAKLGHETWPEPLSNKISELDCLDNWSRENMAALARDLYRMRGGVPYTYDFAVLSKHALSRIYEKYVSVLRTSSSDQERLFPELPVELSNKQLGSYYTPQFVARFFARYLKENVAPSAFGRMKTIDPACGSGMFLRTLLELQCESWQLRREQVQTLFANIYGIDIDPGACNAAKLSLSLLHLVLLNEFPKTTNIVNTDAIKYILSHQAQLGTFDAVVANPPYIKYDDMPSALREQVSEYLGDDAQGKADIFLALLKAGLDLLKPGGHLMYVLPHAFLLGASSSPLRARLSETCWIRLLADLSEVSVFEGAASYTVLLVLQKKIAGALAPRATVVVARSAVGRALQAAIDRRVIENSEFQVFEIGQESLQGPSWKLLRPRERNLETHLQRFGKLGDFMEIRTGLVTGADRVFIRPDADCPRDELQVWRPLLSDREMMPFNVPQSLQSRVFYPYDGEARLTLEQLSRKYPKTAAYLEDHREELMDRRSVQSERVVWWGPAWPRSPQRLFRPKVVGPHLMLVSKFCVDLTGEYAVTRSPVITPSAGQGSSDLLLYAVAVLNSSLGNWQISTQSHKYSRGYAMVEPRTLKEFRVPTPKSVDPAVLKNIVRVTRERVRSGYSSDVDRELDSLVSDLYQLDSNHRELVGQGK